MDTLQEVFSFTKCNTWNAAFRSFPTILHFISLSLSLSLPPPPKKKKSLITHNVCSALQSIHHYLCPWESSETPTRRKEKISDHIGPTVSTCSALQARADPQTATRISVALEIIWKCSTVVLTSVRLVQTLQWAIQNCLLAPEETKAVFIHGHT